MPVVVRVITKGHIEAVFTEMTKAMFKITIAQVMKIMVYPNTEQVRMIGKSHLSLSLSNTSQFTLVGIVPTGDMVAHTVACIGMAKTL